MIHTGKSQQRKGRVAERELSGILQNHGIPARVGDPLNYGSQPDITGIPNIHAEVKRTEKMRLNEWLDQATGDARRFGGCPAIFHRSNRRPWTVTMLLEDWLTITGFSSPKREGGYSDTKTDASLAGTLDVPNTGSSGTDGGGRAVHSETIPCR